MKTLEGLKNEEISLKKSLLENQEAQQNFHSEEWQKEHGLTIGDKISFTSGKKEIIGIFSKLDFNSYDHEVSYPYYRSIKKDGTPGELEKRIWNDELATIKILEK